MKFRLKQLLLVFALFAFSFSHGQEKEEETVGTEQVTIIKSYTPTVSEAFKIKTAPIIDDSLNYQTKSLSYKTLTIPIVSTFSPNKANPLKLKRQKQATTHNTLLALGFGNMGQINVDLSTMIRLNRRQNVGLLIHRDGFFMDIKNTQLRSNQWYDFVGFNHNYKGKYFRVDTQLNIKSVRNNFFGTYPSLSNSEPLNQSNPLIIRNSAKFLNDWNWYKSAFQKLRLQVNVSTDNYSSLEQNIMLSSKMRFFEHLTTTVDLQALTTSFKKDYFLRTTQKNEMYSVGTILQWENFNKNFKYKVGVRLMYFSSEQQDRSSLYYFPKASLSYSKPKSQFIAYLNIGGDLNLNTYQSIFEENPYVAPTGILIPTRTNYNARLGVKTKTASVISLDLSLGHDNVADYPIYERLPFKLNSNFNYRFSNAYQLVFTDLKQFDLKLKTSIDFGNENRLEFSAQYLNYQSTNLENLWNLPKMIMDVSGQFKFADRFFLNFKTSLLGDRDAIYWEPNTDNVQRIERLPLFISSRVKISYHLSKKWDIYLKGRITNSNLHARWGYFPENRILLLAGLRYKTNINF